MLASGMQLGPYKILGPLGAGGMGEVYRAQDARLGRDVALKVLPPRFAEDADHLARFEREAKAVGALAHPNIVVVHDFGSDHGVTFAVTELLEGETLRERLSQSVMPWRKAVELAVPIAEGLAAAHAKGIVHRDLKPGNIFITADERVKILDFGLAKLFSENTAAEPIETQVYSPVVTKTGAILGTAPYMSPEQLRGQPVDGRSDIFSLGCTLYEMVAGKRPFTGQTDADTTAAILHNDPPELADSGRRVPVELERLIRRCLEKNPEARFQSARDLAFALRGIATGSMEVQPAPPSVRRRFYFGLAAAGVMLATAILAVEVWRGNLPLHPPDTGKGEPAGPVAVAVLPFVNITKDPEADYLCDGLPDGINKSLSEVSQLSVKSFNTVSRFRGQDLDHEEMGRKLKVQAMLIGKILPRKGGFTLSVELVNVAADSVLWSERYNIKPADLQTVQLEIARQICSRLKVTMTAEEEKRFSKRHTDNAEAYQLYLIGRYHWYKFTAESTKKAEECFLQAIQKDKANALAYAGLAEVYQASVRSAGLDKMDKAKEAAQRSLELDEELAEAHTALGSILLYQWDWPGAEKEYKRGLKLNPSVARGWDAYNGFLMRMRRFQEADEALKRAVQLDPITPFMNINVAKLHLYKGEYDLAIQESRNLLAVDPDYAMSYRFLGQAQVQKGQYREALEAFHKARQLNGTSYNLALVAYGHAVSGDKETARKLLEELTASGKQPSADAFELAFIHLALGEKDLALALLEKAYVARSGLLVDLNVDPFFDGVRAEPRFVALLKKMKFP
jgi:eukaryotic-like serine/threonine-protein kinase